LLNYTFPFAMDTTYMGQNRLYFNTLDSTNNYASLIAGKSGIPEGTLVWAGFQSAGRGQAGNRWKSEAGKNLTFSLILYPHFLSAEKQFLLSEAISLGITDFLALYIPFPLIKWPNDIFAENRKIGGILIEHAVMGNKMTHTVAGIGLNINQTTFDRDLSGGVSLRLLTGFEYETETCLNLLCTFLENRYESLRQGVTCRLESDYSSRLLGNHRWNTYRDASETFEARPVRVETTGILVLETRRGEIRHYGFKEVEHLVTGHS